MKVARDSMIPPGGPVSIAVSRTVAIYVWGDPQVSGPLHLTVQQLEAQVAHRLRQP